MAKYLFNKILDKIYEGCASHSEQCKNSFPNFSRKGLKSQSLKLTLISDLIEKSIIFRGSSSVQVVLIHRQFS